MKITRIETVCSRFVGVRRVTAEDGARRWKVEIAPAWLDRADHQASEFEA